MKAKYTIAAVMGCAALGLATVAASARGKTAEVKGNVSQILMNPEGDADGFLLEDGTQVHFPPHLSKDLRAAVSAKDPVAVKGVSEGEKRIRAEMITNTKSNTTLKDTPPALGRRDAPPPPPPGAGPGGPGGPKRGALTELTAEGKVAKQLFGPSGNVDGVVLADGTMVHVGPRLIDSSKAQLEIGKQIRASGFGTKNELGTSFEATKVENF